MCLWVFTFITVVNSHFYYNLSDPDSVLNYTYAMRDYFERTGRWRGSSYIATRWDDRTPKHLVNVIDDIHLPSESRKLQTFGKTCNDGVTICSGQKQCLNCVCTIFPTSRYIGGFVYLANSQCLWSNCKCG